MAVTALTLNVPKKVSLGATYSGFSYTAGRNLIYTADAAIYYHPTEKDGDAVDSTEQLKLGAATASIRLPGSGAGHTAIGGAATSGPTNDGTYYFSLATVSGSAEDVWLMVVGENVAR